MTQTLLTLGHGYCARALAARLLPQGWQVLATHRDPDRAADLAATGVTPVLWTREAVAAALAQASHVLVSAGPDGEGDPALRLAGDLLAARGADLDWLGYLSTTGVYGDQNGGWVDEDTPPAPSTARGKARLAAERAWSALPGLPLHIFRLAGIYGPGRGPFEKVRQGSARRIVKPGQVFSRIHVEDIAQALEASIRQPRPGAVYNLCDDDPAPPQEVIAHAARLLDLPPPPEVPFAEADLTPMARSFYAENKRVRNDLVKRELGLRLIHPDYRSGLATLLAETG
ncbi:SDR family oxidoreductase [Salipiger marinus]|uniref:SDR family oxidoreductase n=1 Tax=Salipiger marinus TaxID=555512 RepID=UPI001E5F07A2|nr:SDR family oxidoreductase [Salipiger manganoxidans]MCD1619825.1 SDR family oxidoreductase [Salipiger manganoxidans]MEB3418437.1 SDR family oxidoreductase [Salipiger manganoxidans]